LLRPGYRLEIEIWAPTPSRTALARSTNLATAIADQIRKDFPMLNKNEDAIRATANLWAYRDDRRPTLSLVIINENAGK
jgi:hypothetical protein